MFTVQSIAPDFTLPDQDAVERSLHEYIGKRVLLYFYPKDDTPGCAREACMITEVYDEFEKAGVVVLGVSSDSPASHTKFRKKYNLPFTLLSDSQKHVIEMYDAKNVLGGTKRISYLIGLDGVIEHVYPHVDPATHAVEILKDLAK